MRRRGLLWGASAALALIATATACQRANPAFHGNTGAAGTTSGGAGTSGGGAGTSGGGAGTSGGGAGTSGGGAGTSGGGAGTSGGGAGTSGGGAGTSGGGAGTSGGGAGTSGGGAGTSGSDGGVSNCTDLDRDGYGTGAGCAGLDCNDADPLVTGTASRACYTGPAGTKNVGACRAGLALCTAGVWSGGCNGQVLPSGEACNGEDDDCDGTVDDGLAPIACGIGACARQVASCAAGKLGVCLPGAVAATSDGCDGVDNDCDGVVDEDCLTVTCVHVVPNGDDNGADGSSKPFRNIQTAIAWAAAVPDRPKRLCVAGGATCQDKATYTSPDNIPAVVMANGVSVYGNYESTTWTRCPLVPAQLASPGPTVTIQTQTATGVQFPAAVTAATTLDGFSFARLRGDSLASTAAVTVDGAKQVTLSNLVISDAPSAMASWGINLVNGAQALITRSIVAGGGGTMESIAIRSVAALPVVRENCSTIDPTTGRCSTSSCSAGGLVGRNVTSGGAANGGSAVILLRDSPGALVERNAICGGPANDLGGVRIAGAAAGTVVRGNSILATGGSNESDGVWMDACGDAAPWIVDNDVILGDGPAGASVSAVRALGACHPVIDGNARLSAGGNAANTRTVAVVCGAAGGVASRCSVVGNKLIQGATSNHPTLSIGVSCEAGGCVRVAGNTITGNVGTDVVGVSLAASGPLVERNTITGGCGTRSTAGLLADNASARIENNVVRGAVCANNLAAVQAFGLHVHVAPGGSEIDVHSNTVDAGGAGSCSGAAVVFGTAAAASVGSMPVREGILRNNILRAGACTTARYDFWEDGPPAEPRVFENNDLDPTGAPTALYLDGNATPLPTAAAVNALAGTTAGGNISVDPMFVAPPADVHLGTGSACVNAGTTAGAPSRDFAGKARDAKPDIGAFEQ